MPTHDDLGRLVAWYGCFTTKNWGFDNKPPKWMVKIMENLIKMDDLGVPLFLETPISKCQNSRYRKAPFDSLGNDKSNNHLMSASFRDRRSNCGRWVDLKMMEIYRRLLSRSSLFLSKVFFFSAARFSSVDKVPQASRLCKVLVALNLLPSLNWYFIAKACRIAE